jgi:hypothetical protein
MVEVILRLLADPLLHERFMFSVYMSFKLLLATEALLMTITQLAVNTIMLWSLIRTNEKNNEIS